MATKIRIADIEMLSRLRKQRIRKANGLVTNITLDETLRPLWKLTYYCGILLDWCFPISRNNNNRILKAVRYLLIAFFSALLLAVTSFELMQLLLGIQKAPNIHAIIPNLLWFIPGVISIIIHVDFFRRRKDSLDFFKDWRLLEIEMAHLNPNYIMCKSKRMHLMMYAIYIIITVASVISLGVQIYINPEVPYLISTYPAVLQVVPFLLICSIHLLSIMLIWILTSLGDFVPSFTYYHTALAVSCLENDIRAIFDKCQDADVLSISSRLWLLSDKLKANSTKIETLEFDIPIRRTWARFDNISKMVSRVDFLFGSFMIYGQAGAIFFMTALIYSVFYNLGDSLKFGSFSLVLPYTLNLIAIVFRFCSSIIISSQLHWSVNKFHTTLNYLLNKHWHRMTKGDRDLLRSFMGRLKADSLTANPLGVYKVTPSVFLSVLGVVISYVIVLLQSK